MAKIDKFSFGSITIDGRKFSRDVLIFADGKAHLAPDVESWAKEKNLNLTVQPSSEAIAKLTELTEQKKKVAALIHITC
jgi:hypothetical protein